MPPNDLILVQSAGISPVENISKPDHAMKTILELANKYDHRSHLKAGEMRYDLLCQEVSPSFRVYLDNVKDYMKKIEFFHKFTGTTLRSSQNKDELRIQVSRLYHENQDPKILDVPNETWSFMDWHCDEIQKYLDGKSVVETLNFTDFKKTVTYGQMKAMIDSYLVRDKSGKIIERPEFMFIRVASQLFYDRDFLFVMSYAKKMFNMLFIHASPTLYNAGLTKPQMSSCFLQTISDSMNGILNTVNNAGVISKGNGANGVCLSKLRSGTRIANRGIASGTAPLAKIFEDMVPYVTQGAMRPGATQMTIAVWHVDVQGLLKMLDRSKPGGISRANLTIMTNNLFFERAKKKQHWSMFCPTKAPLLLKTTGKDFIEAYEKYEEQGLATSVCNAWDLLTEIAMYQIETGMPFVTSFDAINRKTNQSNIGDGIVNTLNLCLEVALVSDDQRIPMCNLSSVCLPRFYKKTSSKDPIKNFDWMRYSDIIMTMVQGLNAVIEKNYNLLPEIVFASQESAPIGIGFQGFADLLALMDLTFESEEAKTLAGMLTACAYYNGLYASWLTAVEEQRPYRKFTGSPFSKGDLQFHLWQKEADEDGLDLPRHFEPSDWGQQGTWDDLIHRISINGVFNSQITVSQPTASVSRVTGLNDTWDPIYGVVYTSSMNSGDILNVNRYFQDDMEAVDCYNEETIRYIRQNNGSVQGLSDAIYKDHPQYERIKYIEKKYKTAFEIPQKCLIDLAWCRGPYIDGSQSTSWHYDGENKVMKAIASMFYANSRRLKTVVYYSRPKPVNNGLKYTIGEEKSLLSEKKGLVCTRQEGCVSCE